MTLNEIYSESFFDYVDAGSTRSARQMVPLVRRYGNIGSVLDIGCGRGAWLKVWAENGVSDFVGVDGRLPFDLARSVAADLTAPLDLGRTFDLVQCLEVAEHLPLSAADTIVDSIVRHGNLIFFSSAVPGQGGIAHVNEQPLEFWIERFAARGFQAWDVLRPALKNLGGIEPWYRFNSLLFSRGALAGATERDRYPAHGYDVAASWRLRNALIGLLPYAAVGMLARAKHTLVRSLRRE